MRGLWGGASAAAAFSIVLLLLGCAEPAIEAKRESPLVIPLRAANAHRWSAARERSLALRRNTMHERLVLHAMHEADDQGLARKISWSVGERLSTGPKVFTSRRTVATSELDGDITALGMFFAEVKLGGQVFHVQVDTGSATLAVPVDRCSVCKQGDRRYRTENRDTFVSCSDSSKCQSKGFCSQSMCGACSASGGCCSRYNKEHCFFQLKYADGAGASGSLIHDAFELGSGAVKAHVVFAGIFEDSSDFERENVDGIMGLSPANTACHPSCFPSVLSSVIEQNSGVENTLALCFTPRSGVLSLGGVPKSMITEEPTWFAYSSSLYYDVSMSSTMYVGNEAVQMTVGKTIVDSGTTLLVVPPSLFSKLQVIFESNYCDVLGMCGSGDHWFLPGGCFIADGFPLSSLPPLKFELLGKQNMQLVLEPEIYMLEYIVENEKYLCFGIQEMNFMNEIILGNTVMLKYATIYDRSAQRVGFAKAAPACGL
eukprot:CAMPEP_0185833884 /NCGR_PEP_ID=MMETSP1353-20130828/3631_1 /TAXON_ID=1077150 /ORGANISM="Erythrolobus australicus, Strain CCMP3124" /LENGTH=484 /DNA_ID=CAMNT_0028532223 /DNA_START=55 /DNA_END=1512 /DNA_ORIENTATION=-